VRWDAPLAIRPFVEKRRGQWRTHATSVSTTSRYITTSLQMKRQMLDAFWKRAGLAPTATRKWRPSPNLLAFLKTL
jgi:hypothetical protein